MAINPMGPNNISGISSRVQPSVIRETQAPAQPEVAVQQPRDGVEISASPVAPSNESFTAAPIKEIELPVPGKVTQSKPLGMSGAIAILEDSGSVGADMGSGLLEPAGLSNPRLTTLGGTELNASGFNSAKTLPGQELQPAPSGWNIAPNGIQSGLSGFQYIGS